MSYSVWIDPPALGQVRTLPGNIRQRMRRAIDKLGTEPHPPGSRALRTARAPAEIRRLRIEGWRLVYAISDAEQWVWVLGVRKRPPYDYGDLPDLLARLRELQD